MERSAEFYLSVAKALIYEAQENINPILEAAKSLKNREGFMENLKGSFKAGSLIRGLNENLNLAISLVDKAYKIDPNAKVKIKNEEGEEIHVEPALLKGRALFVKGVFAGGQGNWKDAVSIYEESLKFMPDQGTYYNIGLTLQEIKGIFRDRTPQAIEAFNKCIDIDAESSIAIDAGKELARLGVLLK